MFTPAFPPGHTSRHILVVEDDSRDLELVLSAISRCGMSNRVDVARDGEEALSYLSDAAARADCPAMMLLDLKLPRIGGREVIGEARRRGELCQMPIVVLSSSGEQSDVEGCYDDGANAYLVKPIDFHQFTAAVEDTLAFWVGWNIPRPEPCTTPRR